MFAALEASDPNVLGQCCNRQMHGSLRLQCMRCSFIFPSCHCQCQFYLSDPWRDGFLSKLFALCVVDSRGSFRPARLIVEPLSDYGNSCSRAVACSVAIERGGVFVIPRWASFWRSGCRRPRCGGLGRPFGCASRRSAFPSGSCFLEP